jgi:enamine deaminase RidA (YjgF/YER057c/UK114 family)
MAKQIINPAALPPPRGYSYAVRKGGTPVFISCQVSIDASGQLVGKDDAVAQTEQVFRNLRTVVEASGGTLDDIVKLNLYVTDAAFRPAVVAARARHFQEGRYPASTYVVVSALALPELLVEIEAIAMID